MLWTSLALSLKIQNEKLQISWIDLIQAHKSCFLHLAGGEVEGHF